MIKKLSAYKLYLIFSAATALFFSLVSAVMIIYHIQGVHLNPLQLILVGTTLEVACFMFEIPTGIVADVYSSKLSTFIGIACTALLMTPVVLLYFISIVKDRKYKNVCAGGECYENN